MQNSKISNLHIINYSSNVFHRRSGLYAGYFINLGKREVQCSKSMDIQMLLRPQEKVLYLHYLQAQVALHLIQNLNPKVHLILSETSKARF